MANYNIALAIDNQVLKRLIEEQLSIFKAIQMDVSRPADYIIAERGATIPQNTPSSHILEIPKGAIRCGEIIDKLGYLLSGRESHIESENEQIECGIFVLSPSENTLRHTESGQIIHLTDKERLLLRFLTEAADKGLSRKDLLKSVWGYADDIETHTLETHIYRLRQKLDSFEPHHLITVQDGIYKIGANK